MFSISPGWKTDLDILVLGGSEVKTFDDHLVVRTPNNPDYHWGNCLLVVDPSAVDDCENWVKKYKSHFPNNQWIAIGLPQMPSDISDWKAQGITLEQLEVLSTKTLPKQTDLPAGYTARGFEDQDWETLTLREIRAGLAEGKYESAVVEDFVIETNAARRKLVEEGHAAWFGAFLHDELVANLGIVKCGEIGRYQSVETNQSHRRKGLASHLLGLAAAWSKEQGCESWVIVTEASNDAGRVYRRAGLSADISAVNAYLAKD